MDQIINIWILSTVFRAKYFKPTNSHFVSILSNAFTSQFDPNIAYFEYNLLGNITEKCRLFRISVRTKNLLHFSGYYI